MDDDEKWAAASLRVFSPALTPDELAAELGVQPDRSYRGGDRVSTRSQLPTVRSTNAVFFGSGLASGRPLEEHLEAVLTVAEGCVAGLRGLAGRAEADVFCGFSSGNGQGGFTLSPALLARLAALGLDVGFDLYPPSSEAVAGQTTS